MREREGALKDALLLDWSGIWVVGCVRGGNTNRKD